MNEKLYHIGTEKSKKKKLIYKSDLKLHQNGLRMCTNVFKLEYSLPLQKGEGDTYRAEPPINPKMA